MGKHVLLFFSLKTLSRCLSLSLGKETYIHPNVVLSSTGHEIAILKLFCVYSYYVVIMCACVGSDVDASAISPQWLRSGPTFPAVGRAPHPVWSPGQAIHT